MAKLTIIRGVPGSGKSTYAKKNFNCLILEQDMFHERDGKYQWKAAAMRDAIRWCKDMARHALKLGMDVCVVNTFVKIPHVEEYRRMAIELGASFDVIRMDNDFGNIHAVPETTLKDMKDSLMDSPWPGEKIVKQVV